MMNNMRLDTCFSCMLLSLMLTACSYIHDELEPCPSGLYLAFRYDYNLQQANMFSDHVGVVAVYLFDEEGHFLQKQTEQGTALQDPNYRMRFELPPARYQYVVWAAQKPLSTPNADGRASFVLQEPQVGDPFSVMSCTLSRDEAGEVIHGGLPLDTIWHGMSQQVLEVLPSQFVVDTASLVRDTKHISISLRDLDDPSRLHVDHYQFVLSDRQSYLAWNNQPVEDSPLIYTPYATWNTEDLQHTSVVDGKIAHADFMTSRLITHASAAEDAILSVTNRHSEVEVIRVNLPDLLCQLRTSTELQLFSPQEFLDRGYDYRLTFFLRGDHWEYVQVEISVLSWIVRNQSIIL